MSFTVVVRACSKKICLADLRSEPCTYITKYAAWNCVLNELETKSTVHLILINQNHTVMLWNGIYRQRQWLYHGKCPALLRPSQLTPFWKDPEQPMLRELSRTREGVSVSCLPLEPRMVNSRNLCLVRKQIPKCFLSRILNRILKKLIWKQSKAKHLSQNVKFDDGPLRLRVFRRGTQEVPQEFYNRIPQWDVGRKGSYSWVASPLRK